MSDEAPKDKVIIEGFTGISKKEGAPIVTRGSIFHVFRDKGDAELFCLNNNLQLKNCELHIEE